MIGGSESSRESLPLSGLSVLDFTRLLPGPYCTALLHDLGADIIKIEDIVSGDLARTMPPLIDGVGALFTELNRGKQSVAVDLKSPDGRRFVHALADRSDVVVEGFRPGVVRRLAIDFETLSARNPRLVYCSISGYGQQGLYRDLPGHDLAYAAMSGFLDALFPGGVGVPGVQLVDAVASLAAVIRILAATRAVDRGPQFIDISMADASRLLMPIALSEAHVAAEGDSTSKTLHGSPRYDLFRCADGEYLAVTPLEDSFWELFLAFLRREGLLAADELPSRRRLHEIFRQQSADVWFEMLAAARVPSGVVRKLPDVAPAPRSGRAPALGEHTKSWLQRLGYADDDITSLSERNVIRSS